MELHKVRPVINKTLYRLYEEVSACRLAPAIDFVIPNIKNKGKEYIEKAETILCRYVDYIPTIGYDYTENVWYGYAKLDCSYQAVMQVKSDLLSVAELCRVLQGIEETLKSRYEITVNTLALAHAFEKFLSIAKDSGFITPALLIPVTLNKALNILKQMHELAKVIIEKKTILEEAFDEDIYKLDGQTLYKKLTKQFNGFFPRLFNGEYKRIIGDIKLCKKDGKKLKYKVALSAIDNLRIYQQKNGEFNELQTTVQDLLGESYKGINTDFSRCLCELCDLEDIFATGITFEKLATMSKDEFAAEQPIFAESSNRYQKAFTEKGEAEKRMIACYDLKEYDLQSVSLNTLIEKCEGCHENADKLDNWCEFVKLLRQLNGLELSSFIDYAIENKVEANKIVDTYKKAFYSQWVYAVLHESPALIELARVPHDEAVKHFREKDKLHFEINKAKIKANLSAQRPNLDMVAQGSGIAVLLREGEKKRKQKGIRLLLSEIGGLAQTLKPCFLMSPLSVSTYLSADIKFDVVIFDEASQIFPQDAVGAIYRGEQLIVVGDSKQMPPSNFFNSSTEVDSDDEAEDITDFESILDLCSTAFPQRRLKWHYRSRFEQLISFSNKNFYDNDLVTFPSS